MVLLPRRGLGELDLRVVAGRGVDEARDRLLERGVLGLSRADALAVGREGGLGVVEQALARRVGGDVVLGHQVDGGGRGPLGALLEQDLGEGVGREVGRVDGPDRVVAGEEAGAGRGLEAPGAEVDGLAQVDDRGRREAVLDELGEEGRGLGEGGRRHVHGQEDGPWVVAQVPAVVGEVQRGGEAADEGEGVAREEHGVRELRGQADLAQAREDLVEAHVGRRALGGLGPGLGVGVVLEPRGPEPEPDLAREVGGGGQELVLEGGQAPDSMGGSSMQSEPTRLAITALVVATMILYFAKARSLELRVRRLEAWRAGIRAVARDIRGPGYTPPENDAIPRGPRLNDSDMHGDQLRSVADGHPVADCVVAVGGRVFDRAVAGTEPDRHGVD